MFVIFHVIKVLASLSYVVAVMPDTPAADVRTGTKRMSCFTIGVLIAVFAFVVVTVIGVSVGVADGKKLDRIEISTRPTKMDYIERLAFQPAGMAVSARYNNGETNGVWKKFF